MSLKKHEQTILQQQTIDDEGPGTVVRDFATLLNFIGSEGIQASGTQSLLADAVSNRAERTFDQTS